MCCGAEKAMTPLLVVILLKIDCTARVVTTYSLAAMASISFEDLKEKIQSMVEAVTT